MKRTQYGRRNLIAALSFVLALAACDPNSSSDKTKSAGGPYADQIAEAKQLLSGALPNAGSAGFRNVRMSLGSSRNGLGSPVPDYTGRYVFCGEYTEADTGKSTDYKPFFLVLADPDKKLPGQVVLAGSGEKGALVAAMQCNSYAPDRPVTL